MGDTSKVNNNLILNNFTYLLNVLSELFPSEQQSKPSVDPVFLFDSSFLKGKDSIKNSFESFESIPGSESKNFDKRLI